MWPNTWKNTTLCIWGIMQHCKVWWRWETQQSLKFKLQRPQQMICSIFNLLVLVSYRWKHHSPTHLFWFSFVTCLLPDSGCYLNGDSFQKCFFISEPLVRSDFKGGPTKTQRGSLLHHGNPARMNPVTCLSDCVSPLLLLLLLPLHPYHQDEISQHLCTLLEADFPTGVINEDDNVI